MKKIIITSLFVYSFSISIIFAQLSGDIGISSLNSFKPKDIFYADSAKNQIRIGGHYSIGEFDIISYGGFIEYNRIFSTNYSMDIKIMTHNFKYSEISPDISLPQVSDLLINSNFTLPNLITFIGGIRIPFTDGNSKSGNKSLPMNLQPSLGSFDFYLGAEAELLGFHLAGGFIQPLIQNKNQFSNELDPPGDIYKKFQTTNKFNRTSDLFFRISHHLQLNKSLIVAVSLLPIYHLGNDTYVDYQNFTWQILDSKGLTLNLTGILDYYYNEKTIFSLFAGMPLKSKVNYPDGLKRTITATFELRKKF